MPYDPWTVLGWLMVAYAVGAVIVAPIAIVSIYRARRRSIEQVRPMRPEVMEKIRARANRFPG